MRDVPIHPMPVVLLLWIAAGLTGAVAEDTLADTVARIKPSIVGVGTFQPTGQPRVRVLGSGFVVGDGRHVVTNDHVVQVELDSARNEVLAVFLPGEQAGNVRRAERVAFDPDKDLAVLRIDGPPLPAMRLGDSDRVREGQAVALTGFPIGAVLGLFPATHVGIVAAISPVALPPASARELDAAAVRRLRGEAFPIFQLDLTAYPGNSGGPLYDPRSGAVLGVLNMVFVQGGRERALDRPSGISYAIPGNHLRALLGQAGVSP